jgi:hypothetical protein
MVCGLAYRLRTVSAQAVVTINASVRQALKHRIQMARFAGGLGMSPRQWKSRL